MKKFLSLLLALIMVLGLVACGNNNPTDPAPTDPAPTDPAPTDPADALADAKAYIQSMYKSKSGKVMRDFEVVAVVKIGTDSFNVAWTTDAAAEYVTVGEPADNVVVIGIGENPNEEDLVFHLTATVSANGKSESVTFEYYIPGTPAKASGPVFVDAPEAGSSYKFALEQAELGKTLYFTGEMSGFYLATSENVLDAVNVTIEEVEGGYHLFFEKAGVKTYIDIVPRDDNPGKVNVILTEAPTAVFTWDAERKTMTATVGENTWYLGTYGTYNTISASNVSYIEDVSKIGVSQFPATFATYTFDVASVDAPAAGSSYKFFLTQAELGKTLYFTGEMSGFYLATSEDPLSGVDVTVEEVEGGYRLFFVKAGVKTYIDIVPRDDNPGKVNIVLTEEPTAVFTWDAERKTMTATVGENTWYMGTYGTYNTISASNVSYIEDVSKIGVSQFPATFATINFTYTPNDAEAVDGSSYVYALVQAELGQTLYFTGEMSGFYLATSTNAAAAAKVTAEAVEGGMRFSFMKDGVKTYIDIGPRDDNPGKVNVVLTEEPSAVFTWDAERKVYTAVVGENTWYLGTYGTYNTISASNVSYIEDVTKIGVSQFPAQFGVAIP